MTNVSTQIKALLKRKEIDKNVIKGNKLEVDYVDELRVMKVFFILNFCLIEHNLMLSENNA